MSLNGLLCLLVTHVDQPKGSSVALNADAKYVLDLRGQNVKGGTRREPRDEEVGQEHAHLPKTQQPEQDLNTWEITVPQTVKKLFRK